MCTSGLDLAIDANDEPHIACTSGAAAPMGWGSYYITRHLGTWSVEHFIPGDHAMSRVALGPQGEVHFAYAEDVCCDPWGGRPHYVTKTGGQWVNEVVDATTAWTGGLELAVDSRGSPALTIGKSTNVGWTVTPCTQVYCATNAHIQFARPAIASATDVT